MSILRDFVEQKTSAARLRKELDKLQRITVGCPATMEHVEMLGLHGNIKGWKLECDPPHGDNLNIILSRGEIGSDEYTSVRITLCDLIALARKAVLE